MFHFSLNFIYNKINYKMKETEDRKMEIEN